MGEAKNRGTQQARALDALQRTARLKPAALACNRCQAELTDIAAVDTRALQGIEVAYTAHCTACDQDTWAVRGDMPAVKAFYAALEKAAGTSVQLGVARPGGAA